MKQSNNSGKGGEYVDRAMHDLNKCTMDVKMRSN